MNLTELQVQLRSIEEHISLLQGEIEKMKPQPEDEKKLMFEKITKIAEEFPLVNRNLSTTSNVDVRAYVSCLAYISLADNSMIYEKLLFLCRLSCGMGLIVSAEDVFRMGLEIDKKCFDRICLDLKTMKNMFLVDALIVVNITEEATDTSLNVIADMAKIFNCEKEDIRVLALVAKAVLLDDFEVLKQIPIPSKNCWMGQLRTHIPMEWIVSQRVFCGMVCKDVDNSEKSRISIRDRVPAGSIVKAGDILISYEECIKKLKRGMAYKIYRTEADYEIVMEQKTIVAPSNGLVFFIECEKKSNITNVTQKYIEVYVVSYFDDYTEFCDWHKRK